MSMEDLERRIKALEDIEEIKKLKARYCAYCDDSYDADGIAALFTEDAVWDGGIRGRAEGRQDIRDDLADRGQRAPGRARARPPPAGRVGPEILRGFPQVFPPGLARTGYAVPSGRTALGARPDPVQGAT